MTPPSDSTPGGGSAPPSPEPPEPRSLTPTRVFVYRSIGRGPSSGLSLIGNSYKEACNEDSPDGRPFEAVARVVRDLLRKTC